MSWLPSSRTAQPSNIQVEALISFLEARLDLVGGFSKTKVQKERSHKHWLRIALKLNNMGGAIKTTQRWIKYWNDKKSAVRKKAAIIENSQKNGEGDQEVPELSDVENRILTLLKTANEGNARNSLLFRRLKKEPTDQHPNKNENSNKIHATYLLENEMGEEDEEQEEKESTDSSQNHREENSHTPPTSTFSSSRWGRLKIPPKRDSSPTTQTPPPKTQALPPTTHTNFFLVADRLCRIEQQRLELDRRIVEVLERNSERDFMLVEAVKAMGEGLKALAEAIAKN